MKQKATECIQKNGMFLLLFDIVGSRDYAKTHGYDRMYAEFRNFMRKANERFFHAFAHGTIGGRDSYGFHIVKGDCGGCFLADANVIDDIVDYATKLLPFELRWCVAEDEWDEDIKDIT